MLLLLTYFSLRRFKGFLCLVNWYILLAVLYFVMAMNVYSFVRKHYVCRTGLLSYVLSMIDELNTLLIEFKGAHIGSEKKTEVLRDRYPIN